MPSLNANDYPAVGVQPPFSAASGPMGAGGNPLTPTPPAAPAAPSPPAVGRRGTWVPRVGFVDERSGSVWDKQVGGWINKTGFVKLKMGHARVENLDPEKAPIAQAALQRLQTYLGPPA